MFKDGTQYEGQWKNEKSHGKGHIDLANGDKYTGDWVKDKYNGKGIYVFKDGMYYEIYYSLSACSHDIS